jgi:tRNA(fMet)-specific endonuclease VapC
VKFLLDTNIISAIVTGKSARLLERFSRTPRQDLATVTVVWHEVQFGLAANPGIHHKLHTVYETLFDGLVLLPASQEIWLRAAHIRATLKLRGTPIGPYDLLIAAAAIEHNLILVTNNIREFARVDGLRCEDWL